MTWDHQVRKTNLLSEKLEDLPLDDLPRVGKLDLLLERLRLHHGESRPDLFEVKR